MVSEIIMDTYRGYTHGCCNHITYCHLFSNLGLILCKAIQRHLFLCKTERIYFFWLAVNRITFKEGKDTEPLGWISPNLSLNAAHSSELPQSFLIHIYRYAFWHRGGVVKIYRTHNRDTLWFSKGPKCISLFKYVPLKALHFKPTEVMF